jgi:hypothetical protein
MSEAFLKRSIKKHFRALGYRVSMRRIRLGNSEINGEATGPDGERIAIEIKTPSDDVVRGLGQLAESIAYGYSKAILVTTLRTARKLDRNVFIHYGWNLLGVNSKGEIQRIC